MLHGCRMTRINRIIVIVVSIVVAMILLMLGVVLQVGHSELVSQKRTIVVCQVKGIAYVYNEVYRTNGSYTFDTTDERNKSLIAETIAGCGSNVSDFDLLMRDPWGDELIVDNKSDDRLHIYSRNYDRASVVLYKGDFAEE